MHERLRDPVRGLAILCLMAISSALADIRSADLIRSSEPVLIDDSVSSSEFIETNVRSDIECMVRCSMIGCAVASLNELTGLCQLIVLNDASIGAGPGGSYVQRLVGAKAGDLVWKVPGQKLRLLLRFYNSATGRSGSIQSFVAPVTGCYRIQAFGARGGSLTSQPGGNGAMMIGSFSLTAGTALSIVVGQRGGDSSQANSEACGGGGGGSFVYRKVDNTLLLAAGGGGGASASAPPNHPGQSGPAGTDTTPCGACNTGYKGFGGTNGGAGIFNFAGAVASYNHGGAGAGWLASGASRRAALDGDSGCSRSQGWIGGLAGSNNPGAIGGFGGGGGAGSASGAGGGGGGYSGGGAGLAGYQPGGGGGSYCGGSGCTGTTGGNSGGEHGSVIVEKISAVCS